MESKKWKTINTITKIVLVLLLIPYVYCLVKGIVFQVNGWHLSIPGPALYKWYEIFLFEAMPYAVYSSLFLIADIVLLIISKLNLMKIKTMK